MKDSCGQEIIPVQGRLSLHTNRHTTSSGYSWGWIEGCSLNICWSNENAFNYEKASAFVREYNDRKKKEEGRCCCGKYICSESINMNGTTHEPLGPSGNFCGTSKDHDIRDMQTTIGRLAKEVERQDIQILEIREAWRIDQLRVEQAKAALATARRDALLEAARIAEGYEEKPLCMCFAGCDECTDQPTLAETIRKAAKVQP